MIVTDSILLTANSILLTANVAMPKIMIIIGCGHISLARDRRGICRVSRSDRAGPGAASLNR
jgi:hypothetical protein